MRSITILRIIIYQLFICFLLFIPLLDYFCIDLLINIETKIPSYLLFGTRYETKAFTLPLYISTILYFISYVLIILSFYFFNKIIDQFKKQNIFHLSVIKYFKTIGYLLCIRDRKSTRLNSS